jgi:NADH-quinone oxidoreductase subunit L
VVKFAYLIPLLPLIAAFVQIFLWKRLPRKGDWVSIGAILGSAVISFGIFIEVLMRFDPEFLYTVSYPWLDLGGRFTINMGILVDNMTAVMLVVVSVVSALVHIYSVGYMHGDPRYGRFYSYLSIFSFSMYGLVLSDNLFAIYIFWELVGLSSYLLIGFWFEKKSAADACKKAFLVTRVGDVGMFIGILIFFLTTGVFNYFDLFKAIADGHISGTLLTIAGMGIFCGAIGKSAQFPLHVWLPDAMEGPTPVSALIHAATMVAAGVYLFTPDAFLFISPIACITLFIAGTTAITQNDIKRVPAYSTASQLASMMLGLGVGGFTAGMAHLTTHAAFKACLFLGSGSVIHAVHTQDIQEMGGLWKKMPVTFATFFIATLAISGIPFLSGFYSKDMILAKALEFGMKNSKHMVLFVFAAVTAGMTAFYMFRMVILTFFGKTRDEEKYHHAHESPLNMTVPLVILAVLSFKIFFTYNNWFDHLMQGPVFPKELKAHMLTLSEIPTPPPHGEVVAMSQEVHAAPAESGEEGHKAAPALHGEEGVVAGNEAHAAHDDEHIAHRAHKIAGRVSLIVVAIGISFAVLIYLFGLVNVQKAAAIMKPAYLFLFNKWYFDELYHVCLVKVLLAVTRFLAWFDLYVVDGLVNLVGQLGVWVSAISGRFDDIVVDGAVNGLAHTTIGSGGILRRFQTGKLHHYIFALAGGLLIIIIVKVF